MAQQIAAQHLVNPVENSPLPIRVDTTAAMNDSTGDIPRPSFAGIAESVARFTRLGPSEQPDDPPDVASRIPFSHGTRVVPVRHVDYHQERHSFAP
jgi:hypothetical protein